MTKEKKAPGKPIVIDADAFKAIDDHCTASGIGKGWFMTRAGKYALRQLKTNPKFLQQISEEEAREEAPAEAG